MPASQLNRIVQGIARGLFLVAISVVAAGAAKAVLIQPDAQTRSVSSSAFAQDLGGPVNDAENDQATDFTPFTSPVSALASLGDAEGTGSGFQSSTIGEDGIVASGSASATAESFAEDGIASGSGASIVVVDFTLLTDARYSLQGELTAFDNGSARVILRDASGDIFRDDATGTIAISDSGMLPAGQYTLEVRASGSTSADSPFAAEFAFAEYDVSLQFSTPAVPAFGSAGLVLLALLLTLAGIGLTRTDRSASVARG